MPHLTLEYTRNLHNVVRFDDLFDKMHDVLADVGGISKANCKSRALALDRFYVGDGGFSAGFVHLDVRFLEGRSTELKQEIGRRLLAILKDFYPTPCGADDPQIAVDVGDIQRATYFKCPEGTLGHK